MLSWWQWLIMAAVPPLVIMLYFLKLRRVPVEVPSTYLWRRTVEDMHVNSIWQRLRQNLLLLLQLLTLLGIILALLRPGIRDDQTIGDRSIFLIDQSASMQATDLGSSRLQLAKDKALDLISKMSSDDEAMVIAFSDRADVIQGFASDKRRLRDAIEMIQTTNRTTNLADALNATAGLVGSGPTSQNANVDEANASNAPQAAVYLMSDGRFEVPSDEFGNLNVHYTSIGSTSVENVGIVAFTCQRNPERPDQIEAFARVQNFGETQSAFRAELYWNNQLIDAVNLALEAQESKGVSFEIASEITDGHLEVRLDTKDQFALDNAAFAALTPPRQLDVVVVTDGNTALMAAFQTSQALSAASIRAITPEELQSDSGKQLAASGSIDLYVFDACSPTVMPEANTVFFGALPPGGTWTASAASGPLFVVDVHRTHPLMQYVELGSLLIAEGVGLNVPSGGAELARTDAGVLVAIAPRGAYQDCVLGMTLRGSNTNWPNRRSFPIFLLNALEFLGGVSSVTGARSFQPGQPAILNIANRYDSISISAPRGKAFTLARAGHPQLIFSQTQEIGIYDAKTTSGDRVLQTFAVNLFSDKESDIAAKPEIQIGSQAVRSENGQTRLARKEYWRWLLAAALIALSVEWYVYVKRIAV